MKSNDDFMDLFANFSDRFAAGGLKGFKVYEKCLGTNVTVTRVKQSSETGSTAPESDTQRYNKLLKGAMNISESKAKDHTNSFQTRILINKSQLTGMYTKMFDEMQIVYTKDLFCIGDLITFDYLRIHYRLKVVNIETFGLQDNICFRMTVNPYRES